MAKLWEKNIQVDAKVDAFTVGRDREMDLYLAKYDVLGSIAHIRMLQSVGLIEANELELLLAELKNIYKLAENKAFVIENGVEDVHSQVELMLTRSLGDVGKKIHSGRSRNDQVLLDLLVGALNGGHDGDDRGDTDNNAQHRQKGTHFICPQTIKCQQDIFSNQHPLPLLSPMISPSFKVMTR